MDVANGEEGLVIDGMRYVTLRFRMTKEHVTFGRTTAQILMGFAMGYAAGSGQSYVVSVHDLSTASPRVELAFRDTKAGEPSMKVARKILEESGLSDYFEVIPDDDPKPIPVARGGLRLVKGGLA